MCCVLSLLPTTVPQFVDSLVSSSELVVVLVSCTAAEDALLLGTVLSLLHFYPLVSIEVSWTGR